MPKERDPRRDEARELWEQSNGSIDLVEIAAKLGVSPGTVRGWKSKDRWEQNGTERRDRNVPKRSERSKQPSTLSDRIARSATNEHGEEPDRYTLFAMEYLRDFNATRAAIALGYSKKTAYSIGWELLRKPEVQAEVKRLKELMADELGLDVRRIIAEYMKIAFADVTDVLEFGQREVPVMTMFGPMYEGEGDEKKPVTKIVNYVDFRPSTEIDTTVIAEVKQGKDGVSIKLHDKMRALEKLEKYIGFMTEEDRLKLEKLRAEVKTLTTGEGEPQDDGFIDALKGKAAEVWSEEKDKTDEDEKES